jgi:aldose 1-epimerase
MECLTDQPGLQVYTADNMRPANGKGGVLYGKRRGLCFEAQNWPDAVNQKNFPPAVLRAGDVYRQTTIYRFT